MHVLDGLLEQRLPFRKRVIKVSHRESYIIFQDKLIWAFSDDFFYDDIAVTTKCPVLLPEITYWFTNFSLFLGPNNIPADIVFVVKDKDHPLFRRVGGDLHYIATIPLAKALVGCVIEVIFFPSFGLGLILI